MPITTSPKEICTATVAILEADSVLSELVWFDYSPTSLGTVFATLPAGIVDFDVTATARIDGEAIDQSYKINLPLAIDMFVPITESDTNGRQADLAVWRYWYRLVWLLRGYRYYGKTVDGATITGGNVEGLPVETEETGIAVRYAWLNISMEIAL